MRAGTGEAAAPSPGTRLFVATQHVLPHHALSRVVHWFARVRLRPLKNLLIGAFVRSFRPDMSDAVEPDPLGYPTFNEFFTRALRADARPLATGDSAAPVISPVDGTVSEAGRIATERLLQAKGLDYTLEALLAGQSRWVDAFRDGSFATIYLAPYNYHRIHMPVAGTLRDAWYVPGRLFSVNRATADAVPGLFARNERIALFFEDAAGRSFAVILVGALNVGSMATVWHGDVTPRRPRRLSQLPVDAGAAAPLALAAGAELGRFNMGSTVILLFPPAVAWRAQFVPGRIVRMGELIGERVAAGARA